MTSDCITGSFINTNSSTIDSNIKNQLRFCNTPDKDFVSAIIGFLGILSNAISAIILLPIYKKRHAHTQSSSENNESCPINAEIKNAKNKKSEYISILLIAITALATVTMAVGLFWSDRAIVTLSLGSFDNPPTFLQRDTDGNNYYANVLVLNAGKSMGDINLVITSPNANVSFDKMNWGHIASTEMISTPNSITVGAKKIFIKPQNGNNMLSLELSYNSNPQSLFQDVKVVDINELTYNKTFSDWKMMSYQQAH